MTKARDMFYNLGYKRCVDSTPYCGISYFKDLKNKRLCIHFNIHKKTFAKFKCGLAVYKQDELDLSITKNEHKAILKQIEELGW